MVYVIQESKGKNIVGAMKYGEIKVLFDQHEQIGFSAGYVTKKLKVLLSNFNDNDYLLQIGDPILLSIAAMVASDVNNGRVKMLKWDRQEHVYYPVQAELFVKKGISDEF